MKIVQLVILIAFISFSATASAQISVEFGAGSGKVDFINHNNRPDEENPIPIGPLSFRIIGQEIWLLDTVGNKIIKFDKAGKITGEIAIAEGGAKVLAEDFAPFYTENGSLSYFWLINGFESKLTKYSLEGKVLDELISPDLLQPMRIEIDTDENIVVTDDAAQKIFVFSKNKDPICQQDYEWSGIAVTKEKNTLYRLRYDKENQRTILVKQTLENKIVLEIPLELENHYNSNLWWINVEKGEFVVTYKPAAESSGKVNIVLCGLDGKVKGSDELELPIAMTRYIDQNGFNDVWLGVANYYNAPDGKLEIRSLILP